MIEWWDVQYWDDGWRTSDAQFDSEQAAFDWANEVQERTRVLHVKVMDE